ncbi:MAG: hypothetical protein JJD97_09315, partial [Gemmatimonadaceae bacterium]|nr:hypothetical protein [Gemmatimonadaceae bacterium]
MRRVRSCEAIAVAGTAARARPTAATSEELEGSRRLILEDALEKLVFGGGKEVQAFSKARFGNGLLPEGSSGALRRLPYEIDG